ncbi:GDSL-type esterase/lipase family protein [Clostridium sp. CX1]|uniref:GDSL-type esterase/lipase family protein n=1 Tax=Clostridium sp. CX1 TaxID=2978346 RepID=UPI0021C10379|nr:GDSL-type esterase/lipase family protein [Clostridium sp. CX1]MCT8976214.1 GDSL-type esterase/lipase family protein [Clostridium sp. CX1]
MKLVCIGDSLTTGYGVFRNECWVQLVSNNLNIEIINKGSNGDTTAGMLSRSYTDVIENNPSHVIIMGGCNDFMGGRSLNMVTENLSELVKEAIHHNVIPIIGIEPFIDKALAERKWSRAVDYDEINNVISSYRSWIIKFTKDNCINHLDFYHCFDENLKTKNPRELYIDGLHPTALGHKLMADCVTNLLQAMKLSP